MDRQASGALAAWGNLIEQDSEDFGDITEPRSASWDAFCSDNTARNPSYEACRLILE